PLPLALRGRDLALNRVDPGAEALNRRAEDALARLVPLDLIAFLLDARRQRRRQSRQREQQECQDGKAYWEQEALLHHGWSAAGFPTFTPVMQGFSALSPAPLKQAASRWKAGLLPVQGAAHLSLIL